MKLLAIETSTQACSLALKIGQTLVERHVVQAKIHTKILIPGIQEMLAEHNINISDLDAIVLGNGPGSFIGMRIGASVAQGLAFAAGLGIVPISSLAAVAAEAMDGNDDEYVAVCQDARMSEVYLGCYRRGQSGLPVPLMDEAIFPATHLEALDAIADRWVAAGGGWQRYPILAEQHRENLSRVSVLELPRARHLIGLAIEQIGRDGTVAPAELQPAYLRHQVATPPKA